MSKTKSEALRIIHSSAVAYLYDKVDKENLATIPPFSNT